MHFFSGRTTKEGGGQVKPPETLNKKHFFFIKENNWRKEIGRPRNQMDLAIGHKYHQCMWREDSFSEQLHLGDVKRWKMGRTILTYFKELYGLCNFQRHQVWNQQRAVPEQTNLNHNLISTSMMTWHTLISTSMTTWHTLNISWQNDRSNFNNSYLFLVK